MKRFRLLLEYDGSDFHGWQAQDGVRTVEGVLRQAFAPLVSGPLESAGASRTDTGVHALGQCALLAGETRLDASELRRALRARTPHDVGILECHEAEPEFHPRFSALEKCYLYRLNVAERRPTFGGRHQWWLREPLDLDAMRRASLALLGEHDFAAFRNRSKDEPEETVRSLRAIDWSRHGDHVVFQVIGSGFLYRMVRNLVGTLVEVGRGQRDADEVAAVLASGDRRRAGTTAPPQGLFLVAVAYPSSGPCRFLDGPPLF